MSNPVNVDFVTKVVEVEVNDTQKESLAAAAAIASAGKAAEKAEAAADSAAVTQALYDAIAGQYGYPFTASTVADMTDTTKIYVYTGSESGYTAGNWYYYNGSAWVSGGVFNSIESGVKAEMSLFGIDDLLWDNTSPYGTSASGITKTYDTVNKTITLTGTASDYSNINFLSSSAPYPAWLEKGKPYIIHMPNITGIYFQIYVQHDGESTPALFLTATKTTAFIIPADAVGIGMRVQVAPSTVTNCVIRPFISEAPIVNVINLFTMQKSTVKQVSHSARRKSRTTRQGQPLILAVLTNNGYAFSRAS